MPVRNRLAQIQPEAAHWRRHLHANPELRFEEHETARFVAEKLREFGCDEVIEGVGRTGVVGLIRGNRDVSGRVIGFRADMDALPIRELTGAEHASTVLGRMHACGHDGHTATLLAAAQYLSETRNFDGTVALIFQPAEEGGGGARAMLADGLLERFGIDEVYGLHNWPGLPVGQFALTTGPLMGAVDFFTLTIQGRGGHGAMPEGTVDATLAAAQLVAALQSVVSRNVDPLKTAVLSVCSFHTDTDTFNVIADRAELKGTVRYLDREVQALVKRRMQELADSIAAAHGATATLDYVECVPPTINEAEGAHHAAEAARAVAGDVTQVSAPTLAGEDFAEMLARRPGAFVFLGNGDSAELHNPAYDFDDAAIPVGASWFAELAERRMPLD